MTLKTTTMTPESGCEDTVKSSSEGEDDDIFDTNTNTNKPEKRRKGANTEHSDPDSYSWYVMRVAILKIAQHKLQQFLQLCGIEVSVKPRIDRTNLNPITVKAGLPVSLDVKVFGEPPATVTWHFKGDQLKNGPNLEIINLDYNTKFLMTKSKRTNSGKYVIKANNEVGEDEAEVEITIHDEPGKAGRPEPRNWDKDFMELEWSSGVGARTTAGRPSTATLCRSARRVEGHGNTAYGQVATGQRVA